MWRFIRWIVVASEVWGVKSSSHKRSEHGFNIPSQLTDYILQYNITLLPFFQDVASTLVSSLFPAASSLPPAASSLLPLAASPGRAQCRCPSPHLPLPASLFLPTLSSPQPGNLPPPIPLLLPKTSLCLFPLLRPLPLLPPFTIIPPLLLLRQWRSLPSASPLRPQLRLLAPPALLFLPPGPRHPRALLPAQDPSM